MSGFIYIPKNLYFFHRYDLIQLVTNRIGTETFTSKLSQVAKNDKYSQALQKPQPHFKTKDDVIFDHEFANLFKCLEGKCD